MTNNIKRIVSLVLVTVLAILVACTADDPSATEPEDDNGAMDPTQATVNGEEIPVVEAEQVNERIQIDDIHVEDHVLKYTVTNLNDTILTYSEDAEIHLLVDGAWVNRTEGFMTEIVLRSLQSNSSVNLEVDLEHITEQEATGSYRLLKRFRLGNEELILNIPFTYE